MKTSDLFETRPFLEHRLGADLFSEIPQDPGIYRFYDEKGQLLYVGKAKNLRRRLFTYKRARPGKTSGKESRLISQIQRIEFEVLESEEEAILEENRWIREYRPEFNHANKHTETYYFISVQQRKNSLMFGLSMNSSGQLFPEIEKPLYQKLDPSYSDHGQTKTYGCFKGHRTVRISLGSLLQLLWMNEFDSISPHFLPIQLSRNLTPMRFHLPLHQSTRPKINDLYAMIDRWFLGNSMELLEYLKERIEPEEDSIFTKTFIEENIIYLDSYFQKNLHRYRILREIKGEGESHLIDQTELDDLITRHNNTQLTTSGN